MSKTSVVTNNVVIIKTVSPSAQVLRRAVFSFPFPTLFHNRLCAQITFFCKLVESGLFRKVFFFCVFVVQCGE